MINLRSCELEKHLGVSICLSFIITNCYNIHRHTPKDTNRDLLVINICGEVT